MQQTGDTCTSVGTAVLVISQQLSCKALIYTDILIEPLPVEISVRNPPDYQVNNVLISPYSWALCNVCMYVCTGLFISPSGISELDCATTKTDTAERSI